MPTVPQLDIPSFPSPPRQASRSPRGGGYRTATGFTPRGLLPRGADGVATSVARPGAAPLAASGSAAVLPRGSPSKGTPRRRVGGPASPRGSPRCSPRGAASGSGARAVRELADAGDSAHVFGGISELATDADAMKVSLQGWVQGYNAEVDSFPSVALFCEMKLAEATALHGDSRGPNAFRTAVACDLHGKVCSLFGRYRGLLGSMHRELISSIYPLDAAGDRTPRLTNADAVDVFTTAPYFVRSSELQQENSLMTGQLFDFRNKDDFLEKENLRRQFAVSFTVKMYGKKMRAQYFTRWKLITQSGNQYRMIIDSMGSKGRGKGKLGKCFHSWREQVVEHKIQALKNTIETSGKLDFEMQRTRDEQLSELHAKVNKMGDDGKTKEKQKAYLAKILITEHQERIKGRDSDVKSALLMGNLNEIMQEAKLEEMDMRKQVKMLNRATNEQYKRAREAAATKISTAYRGRQARAEVQDLRDQHAAADTIQARIRGRNERRAYKGRRAAYASALENDAHVPTSATDAQHVRTAIDVLLLELSEVKRSIATMPDATVLGFGVLDLGVMESDRCWATIRKWINWCLAQLNMESRKLSSKVDFKATFSDSEVLAALLEVVSPQIDGKSTVTEVRRQPTAVDRAKLITKRLTEMDGRHGLTAQHIVDGHAFDIQHTLGKLFIEFHSLPSISSARIDKNWQTLSVLETEWNVHRRKGWLTKTALGELKSAVRELLQEIAVLQEEFKDASKRWFNIEQSMVKFSWSLVDTKLETISSLMGTLDDDDAGDKQNTVGQTTAGVTGAVSGDLKAFGMADATPEEAKAELSLLSQELDTHGADLIKTFKHYAAKGTSHVSQISADDFKVFIAECKLPKNGISTAHIGVIFVTVNRCDPLPLTCCCFAIASRRCTAAAPQRPRPEPATTATDQLRLTFTSLFQ